MFFQLITNGVLTGRGIVFYSAQAVAGVGSVAGERPPMLGHGRVFYAPFEDLLFGFALVVQTLSWWVFWGRREQAVTDGSRVEPVRSTFSGKGP